MKSYPMLVVVAVVVTVLLALDYFRPSLLLYQTECATIDSLRTYRFVVSSEPRETDRCLRYETQQRVLLYLPKDTTHLSLGDTVIARTRIHRGGAIGTFNYGLYLRRQGIIGYAYARNYEIKPTRHVQPQSLQKRLYRRLEAAGLHGDELATTGALTLGYKEDLDPQLKRHFQAAGAAHVLAVSGLHTGIIYGLLLWLLTFGGRFKPRYENRIGRTLLHTTLIIALWAYAWLTGLTPSVVRCAVMLTLIEIGIILYRQTISLNTIAAAAVLILLVRPLDLWNIGFQLSFAATTAIVIIAQDFEGKFHRKEWRHTLKGQIISWFAGTILVSLAAQLGTLPITMYTFGQVSNYFLLTNLIVLPLTTFLVPCGLASIALGGIGIGKAVGWVTNGLAWAMNHSVAWIESLPGSVSYVRIDGLMVLLLYLWLFFAWFTFHPRAKQRNR